MRALLRPAIAFGALVLLLVGLLSVPNASADDPPQFLYKVPDQPSISFPPTVEVAGNLVYTYDGSQLLIFDRDAPEREIRIGTRGQGPAQLDFISDIAIYAPPTGPRIIYLADTFNDRIQRIQQNMLLNYQNPAAYTFLGPWGGPNEGSGDRQFSSPQGVAVDASNTFVYVSDTLNHRVQKILVEDGSMAGWLGGCQSPPVGFTDNCGADGVSDGFSCTQTTCVIAPGPDGAPGQFFEPSGIDINSAGDIYVAADNSTGRVEKFTSAGTFVRRYDTDTPNDYCIYGCGGSIGLSVPPGATNGFAFLITYKSFLFPPIVQKYSDDDDIGFMAWLGGCFSPGAGTDNCGDDDISNGFTCTFSTCDAPVSGGSRAGEFEDGLGGLDIATNGDIYVADSNNNRIQRFNAAGTPLGQYGAAGSADGFFREPSGIAVGPAGNVYVADTDNARVQVFNSSGGFLRQWLISNPSEDRVEPVDVAVDSTGNVFVLDSSNGRVLKYTPLGVLLLTIEPGGDGGLFDPQGLGVDAQGNVYVADSENRRVQKYNGATGALLASFTEFTIPPRSVPEPFKYVTDVAVDSLGNIYVTDGPVGDETGFYRVVKLSPAGDGIATWVQTSTEDYFDGIAGIAIGPDDAFYVVEPFSNEINKFDADGSFILSWGSSGSGNEQFNSPRGIAVGANNRVYIADTDNDRYVVYGQDVVDPPPTDTHTPTNTPTNTPTGTLTPSPTATSTRRPLNTRRPTLTPTNTRRPTQTPTSTPTLAVAAVATSTPTPPATTATAATSTTVPPTVTTTTNESPLSATPIITTTTNEPPPTVSSQPPATNGQTPPTGGQTPPTGGAPPAIGQAQPGLNAQTTNAETATSTPPPTGTPAPTATVTIVPTPTATRVANVESITSTVKPPADYRPALFKELPSVQDIPMNADVIATNVILAGLLMLIVLIDASIFNSTVKENADVIHDSFGRLFAPFIGIYAAIAHLLASDPLERNRIRDALKGAAIVGLTGLLYCFLDPTFGLSATGLVLFVSLAVGVALTTYIYDGGQVVVGERLLALPSALRFYPIAIFIAAVSVFLSRVLDLQPGLVYGFAASASIFGMRDPDRREEGQLVLLPMLMLVAAGITGWLLLDPIRELNQDGNNLLYAALEAGAAAVFIGGIQGALFNLIPLEFMDGLKLWRWSRVGWCLLFIGVAFIFFEGVLKQDATFSSATGERPVQALFLLTIVAWAMTMVVWLYFRVRKSLVPA